MHPILNLPFDHSSIRDATVTIQLYIHKRFLHDGILCHSVFLLLSFSCICCIAEIYRRSPDNTQDAAHNQEVDNWSCPIQLSLRFIKSLPLSSPIDMLMDSIVRFLMSNVIEMRNMIP